MLTNKSLGYKICPLRPGSANYNLVFDVGITKKKKIEAGSK
jgi:hypothetical protein